MLQASAAAISLFISWLVAVTIVNVQGNTLSTSFQVGPQATVLTPDTAQNFAQSLELSGTPAVGGAWSVTLSFNDGAGIVTSTHEYIVQASVSLAEVAAALAAKINAAGTGFTASVNGNTLVLTNANQPGFTTSTRIAAPAGTTSTTGTVTRSVASPAVTRLTLTNTAAGSPGGVPVGALIGETWTVTVDGVSYSYTVESPRSPPNSPPR
jgi:hypothetical protein